ncbi:MAG: hypothetical protein IJP22_02790 [Clostridia bacterium]|nr:hypothetical protein [Clostridia bacterium]
MSLKIKNFAKLICVLVAVVLLVAMIPTSSASAVAYKGSGTKKDPYLVTNAEQLDGMRNNLSAHYKLANTIDMKSIDNFEPIGFIAKPFTGTFTCDVDKDGLPKFAIKNITINNKRGLINKHAPNSGNTPDYKKNNSKWETGLFGMTKGAEISNIYVLDANVICSVVGELSHVYPNGRDNPYVPVKGADEQGTGILAGMAHSTTFVNCAATGKVDSKSNYTGGLLGRVEENSFIEYCWADVDVKSTGCWAAGAFVGEIISGSTIQFCYSTGDIDAPMKKSFENVSLDLVGGMGYIYADDVIVSDCYTTGKVSSNGYSFAPVSVERAGQFMNCWTTGKVEKLTAKPSAPEKAADNCLVLNETGHRNGCFTPASKKEIANAFKDLEGWEIGEDGMPRISKIPVLKDASIYKPSKDLEVVVADNSGDKNDATSQSTGTTSKEETSSTTSTNSGSAGTTDSETGTTDGDTGTTDGETGTTDGEVQQGTTEQGGETTQTEVINPQVQSEKQILMIVLAAIIVAISVLTGAVLVTMIVKGKKS